MKKEGKRENRVLGRASYFGRPETTLWVEASLAAGTAVGRCVAEIVIDNKIFQDSKIGVVSVVEYPNDC